MEGANQICQSRTKNLIKKENGGDQSSQIKWGIIQEHEGSGSSDSMESFFLSESESEDASSSSSSSMSSSPSSADGPLFQLSDLMNQLPIKRGLSKHYSGKSQSFTSLAHVRNVEDLGKKVSPYGIISSYKRMKTCKSYGGFESHNNKFRPKATITKKSAKGTSFFLSSPIAR